MFLLSHKSVCIALNDTVVEMVVLCWREENGNIALCIFPPPKSVVLWQCMNGKITKNQTIKVFHSAFGSVSINIFRHWILSDFGVL